MIYFTLAGNRTNDIKTNAFVLMSKHRGNKNSTVFHNNRYSTVLSFRNEVFKEYFKFDASAYVYRQIKKYDTNNLPFKVEVIDHEENYHKDKF